MNILLKLIAEAIGTLWRMKSNKTRSNQVSAVAEELGLEFLPHVNMMHELDGCELTFNKGLKGYCINCFGGKADGIEFKIFEYNFTTGYGQSRVLYRQTVAAINLGHDCLPDFQVKGKEFLSKIFAQPVNTFDVNDPVFSKRFWLSSLEPTKARMLFNDEVKAAINGQNWSVESSKGRLLVYRAGQVVDHTRLKDFLTNSLQLMAHLEDAQANPAPYLLEQFATVGS